MTQVRWERYPLVAQSPHARSWLSMQGNLGLAQNTIEAYGRALEDYLAFSTRESSLLRKPHGSISHAMSMISVHVPIPVERTFVSLTLAMDWPTPHCSRD